MTVDTVSGRLRPTLDGRPFVASPIHKQRFDLATGRCLDADGVSAGVFAVRIVDGVLEVASTAPRDDHGPGRA